MTSPNFNRTLNSFSRKTTGFSADELSSVLNLMDDPAIIVDRGKQITLIGNNLLVSLTAFSAIELINKPLNELIPDLNLENIQPNERIEITLNRYKRPAVEVIGRVIPIDSTQQKLLVMLTPISHSLAEQARLARQTNLLQSLKQISGLVTIADAPTLFQSTCDLGSKFLGVEQIAIYTARADYPQMTLAAKSSPDFAPFLVEGISSQEFIKMRTQVLWTPGKKVLSELQRNARIANLTYLATAPLGPETAYTGLLVVAGCQAEPQIDLLDWLEVFAGFVTTIIDQFSLLDTSRHQIQKYRTELAVKNEIIENADEGIVILSPDLLIQHLNPAAELMLGYALTEVLNLPAESILIGPDNLPPALKSAAEGMSFHDLGGANLHRRDGIPFPVNLQVIPLVFENNLNRICLLIRDISDYEQARIKTQQLEQRAVLGDFASTLAHEVRNPINNLTINIQTMSEMLPDTVPTKEDFNRLSSDCTRLTLLAEAILSFSRSKNYQMEKTDLVFVIKRLLDRWTPRFRKESVQPVFNFNIQPANILGDIRSLEQVFTNLVDNSVQAMHDCGGTLAIRISKMNDFSGKSQYEVTVTDNGPGIPPEILDRIFEPFVTTKTQGTGLGLAITKTIVTAHRGSIQVNSFPGGTVFRIFLPEYDGE